MCEQEQIENEKTGLQQLAQSAEGSMRDALSLLDQAIAYGNGKVSPFDVQTMLGIVAHTELVKLLQALAQQNGMGLMQGVENLVLQGADCEQILTGLFSLLHRITITQVIPEVVDEDELIHVKLSQLGQLFSKEQIQLLYQIALLGRRAMQLPHHATAWR